MKYLKIVCAFLITIYALINLNESQANELDSSLEGYVEELNSYCQNSNINIDMYKVASNLRDGKGLDYDNMFQIIMSIFLKEIRVTLYSSSIIIILIIISSVIKNIQIESQSEVIKITSLVCFAAICTVIIASFTNMLDMFKTTCLSISSILEVISPFILGMLIVNGAISSVRNNSATASFCFFFCRLFNNKCNYTYYCA